jgi:lysophospholipase L1-like esterase
MKNIYTISLIINILGLLFICVAIQKIGSLKHIIYLINHKGEGIGLTIETRKEILLDMKIDSNSIVMLGNSLTSNFDWTQKSKNINVINFGIPGETTSGVLRNLNKIIDAKPSKIFLEIGVNDICSQIPLQEIITNYASIIQRIRKDAPSTLLYVNSVLPVNNSYRNTNGDNQTIEKLNTEIELLAKGHNTTYLNLYPLFLDDKNELKSTLTNDGIHLLLSGYEIWYDYIAKYI